MSVFEQKTTSFTADASLVRWGNVDTLKWVGPAVKGGKARSADRVAVARASSPDTSPSELIALAQHPDVEVRRLVGKHINANRMALAGLAADDVPSVRVEVAGNPRTPPHILLQMIRSEVANWFDWSVLSAALRNPNFKGTCLAQLISDVLAVESQAADDFDEVFDNAYLLALWIARNPNLSDKQIRALDKWDRATDAPAHIRPSRLAIGLLEHQNCPTDLLKARASDSSYRIRATVAKHRATPPETLEELVRDKVASVRAAVVANPSAPKKRTQSGVAATQKSQDSHLTPVQKKLQQILNSTKLESLPKLDEEESALVRAAIQIRQHQLGLLSGTELKTLARNSTWLSGASRYLAFAKDHGQKVNDYVALCITLNLDRALAKSIRSGLRLPASAFRLLSMSKGTALRMMKCGPLRRSWVGPLRDLYASGRPNGFLPPSQLLRTLLA